MLFFNDFTHSLLLGVARGLVEKDGSGDTGIPGSSPAGGRLAVPG